MADNRFDNLSKRLALRFSRRTVIKGAGAALGAGAVASVAGSSAGALGCPSCFDICSFPLYYYTPGVNYVNVTGDVGCASVLKTPIGPNLYKYEVGVRLTDAPRGTYQIYLGSLCTATTTPSPFLYVGQITVGPFGVGCVSKTVYRTATCTLDLGAAEVIVGTHGINGAPIPYWTTGAIPDSCGLVD